MENGEREEKTFYIIFMVLASMVWLANVPLSKGRDVVVTPCCRDYISSVAGLHQGKAVWTSWLVDVG